MADEGTQDFNMQECLSTMFGTPFVSIDWPGTEDMNRELFELIMLDERNDDMGRGIRSNAGGWQSRARITRWISASAAPRSDEKSKGREPVRSS